MTYVVASFEDRSGSSNYASLSTKHGRALFVKRDYASASLVAYGVSGHPADCVLFAIRGLLKDRPPDLVVSGINGGPNLGVDDWFGSGTIGAARAAAYLGIPAIAVSGLDDDDAEMVDAVTAWVVEFSKSQVVQQLQRGEYLTISIPEKKASEIRGVKVVERAPPLEDFELVNVWTEAEEGDDETEEIWLVHKKEPIGTPPPESDVTWLERGYIVIVPMRVDEHDRPKLAQLQGEIHSIPEWRGFDRK